MHASHVNFKFRQRNSMNISIFQISTVCRMISPFKVIIFSRKLVQLVTHPNTNSHNCHTMNTDDQTYAQHAILIRTNERSLCQLSASRKYWPAWAGSPKSLWDADDSRWKSRDENWNERVRANAARFTVIRLSKEEWKFFVIKIKENNRTPAKEICCIWTLKRKYPPLWFSGLCPQAAVYS